MQSRWPMKIGITEGAPSTPAAVSTLRPRPNSPDLPSAHGQRPLGLGGSVARGHLQGLGGWAR